MPLPRVLNIDRVRVNHFEFGLDDSFGLLVIGMHVQLLLGLLFFES